MSANYLTRNYQVGPLSDGSRSFFAPYGSFGAGSMVSAASDSDGNIATFSVGTDGNIYLTRFRAPYAFGTHTTARPMPDNPRGAKFISALSADRGALYLFWIDTDGAAHVAIEEMVGDILNPGYNNWSTFKFFNLGGNFKEIAAAPELGGNMRAFATDQDLNIFECKELFQGALWSTFTEFGGQAKQLSPVRSADGRLFLFHLGSDHDIYYSYQTAANSDCWDWGVFTAQVSQFVVGYCGGYWEIFGSSLAGGKMLWWSHAALPFDGLIPSPSQPLQSVCNQRMAMVRNANGLLRCIYIGLDGHIHSKQQTRAGTTRLWPDAPIPNNGQKASDFFALERPDGNIEILTIGDVPAMGTIKGRIIEAKGDEDSLLTESHGSPLYAYLQWTPPHSSISSALCQAQQDVAFGTVFVEDGVARYEITGVPINTPVFFGGSGYHDGLHLVYSPASGAQNPVTLTDAGEVLSIDLEMTAFSIRLTTPADLDYGSSDLDGFSAILSGQASI